MSVVDVLRKHDESANISLDDRYRASASRTITWTVTVNDPANDTVATVEASVLVVQVGNAHPDSIYYRCKRRDTRRVSPILFEVTATYETPQFDPGTSGTDSPNPLTVPPLITYSTVTTEEPIDIDINGAALATANGESYTGITRAISDLQVTIVRNYAAFTGSAFYLYIDSVNSDSFLGFPPGTAKVNTIEAREIIQDDWRYWEVSVSIQFRKPYLVAPAEAWYKRVRHEGFMIKKSGVSKPVRGVDGEGNPIVQPVLLASDGTELPANGTPHYQTFKVYESRAFSGMALV